MSAVSTRGVLLRSHPYSETSRVLRFLTEDHGVVGVMAKGIRKGPRGGGMDLFGEVALTLHMKPGRDLQTLGEVSPTRPRRGLGSHPLRLACAGVLGELVLRHHGEAPSHEVFESLGAGLDRLEAVTLEAVPATLLVEGWRLVSALGFHPQVEACVVCGRPLGQEEVGRFDFDAGGVRCASCAEGMVGRRVGPGARVQLLELLAGRIPPELERPRAHLQLLSDFVTHHVSGVRPLEAFRVLASFLPPDPPRADA
ncbi:MAG TPA: DNA repair protein RecO [Longimicrobiales bacterium]|nr:DNA repair protein RecO [Longimicrobiales bacterium]